MANAAWIKARPTVIKQFQPYLDQVWKSLALMQMQSDTRSTLMTPSMSIMSQVETVASLTKLFGALRLA